jgi:hypothetical protein
MAASPPTHVHLQVHVTQHIRSFAGNKPGNKCIISHLSVCGMPLGSYTFIFSKTIKAIYVPEMFTCLPRPNSAFATLDLELT